MSDKLNDEYYEARTAAYNYNNVTGGADSASGGSGGSGMDCLPLRTPPEPFHYLISEAQAKSLVALQELQNEVGALLEFRDLVIETFPNLRSKMPPSTPASSARRDWEPGVRVRRKLAAGTDSARAKPQPSVQDSGFSTETSCGKDAHSSASASASRSRPLEDELWALLDVIQRKGGRLRDEAEQLRSEIDVIATAEESFSREIQACDSGDLQRLRIERDALLSRAAELEAAAAANPPTPSPSSHPPLPLGRLDSVLETPARPPRVLTPDAKKFAAILLESNPVELQRQLLTSTVQNQVLCDRLRRAAERRTLLLERLEKEQELNDDLKFRLEEKSIELEGARARLRQIEGNKMRGSSGERSRTAHSSMRDMEPLAMPDGSDEERIVETPRLRPSRIPLHTANKGAAPRPPAPGSGPIPRPPSSHSVVSTRSGASGRRSAVPVRRSPTADTKSSDDDVDSTESDIVRAGQGERRGSGSTSWSRDSLSSPRDLAREYVERASRLAPLVVRTRPLPADLQDYRSPQNLALELSNSLLYSPLPPDDLWNGKPQQYFESMNYAERNDDTPEREYDIDSLAP